MCIQKVSGFLLNSTEDTWIFSVGLEDRSEHIVERQSS